MNITQPKRIRGKRYSKQKLSFFLLTVPPLVIYIVFFIYPTAMSFYYSMTNWNGIYKNYQFIGLKNYVNILGDSRFGNSLTFTLKYTALSLILNLGAAFLVALLLNGKLRARGFIRSVYFFPAVLSMITIGLIFNQIFYSVLPAFGERIGIEWLSKNLLAYPDTAIYAVLLTNLWQGFAIPSVIFMAGLAGVPKDLQEAAMIDGANSFQRFIAITFPFSHSDAAY